MAVRVRVDGRILCAAMHPQEPGDVYLDDEEHYWLSVEMRILVTEPMRMHRRRGEWWWYGHVPAGIEIDDFYRRSA